MIKTDFCVVGGGIAGICAAIAAAREGIKVVLMHERPVLGGNASSEIRMWICGAQGTNNRETGILEEIMLENLYRNPTKNFYIWDTILYDLIIREENIHLLLNCTCMDAKTRQGEFKDGRNIKIESISGYQMTTQTFFDVSAEFFSDCSGDSILAPLTKADFRIGRESSKEFSEDTQLKEADNFTMGMSCLLQGRETEKDIKYVAPDFSKKFAKGEINRIPNLNKTSENFWYLELGGDRDTIGDTEDIARELIPLATGVWDYVKNSGEQNASKWELEFLGFLPGKRESRRMVGEYMITQRDISAGVVFDDVIAFGGWPLDDHFPLGFYHNGPPNINIETPSPYTLPYRTLYSKNVENLFFAGRNISMTHMAMSSIRVMATCGLLGQAVGTAAAIAVKNNLVPNQVYKERIGQLQKVLMNNDCFLPYKKRDISPVCVNIASFPELCNGEDRPNRIYGTTECGVQIKNSTAIEYNFKTPQNVSSVHIVFDSDLNRKTLPGDDCERSHATRSNVYLRSPQMHMPKTLCKDFVLKIETQSTKEIIYHINDNKQRAYHFSIEQKVNAMSLTPISNWGDTDVTSLFSFDFQD